VAVELNYSALDRLLHRLAFAGPSVQLAAADMERSMFRTAYESVRGARPIFITSLPRAGTTLMLEALHVFPSLASHVYRDMPFVLAPVIWARLSASFRKPQTLRERAHGDGMEVGFDSPEAFEEVLWRTFWPEKYHDTYIDLWTASDGKADATAFFVEHMKKIIALRRPERAGDGRYVSKNNANIARLDLIGRMFPDARILVPVRQPLEHARSLLNQHRRFLKMHQETPFTRRYMADIGHYEFGTLHRAFRFPGLEAVESSPDGLSLDYWLAYWIAGFEYVLARKESVVIASYEGCCLDAVRALTELCARLDIADEGALEQAAALFRDTPSSRTGGEQVNAELLHRANRLHATLLGSTCRAA
jgi:hypothetical protein